MRDCWNILEDLLEDDDDSWADDSNKEDNPDVDEFEDDPIKRKLKSNQKNNLNEDMNLPKKLKMTPLPEDEPHIVGDELEESQKIPEDEVSTDTVDPVLQSAVSSQLSFTSDPDNPLGIEIPAGKLVTK